MVYVLLQRLVKLPQAGVESVQAPCLQCPGSSCPRLREALRWRFLSSLGQGSNSLLAEQRLKQLNLDVPIFKMQFKEGGNNK